MDIIYRYDPYKPIAARQLEDADAAIDVLRRGHDRYTTIVTQVHKELVGDHSSGQVVIPADPLALGLPLLSGAPPVQTPFALVLGCSDARVPIELIRPGAFQPRRRFDEAELDALAQSIREKGIIQPLLVRPLAGEEAAFELIAGERRWRAVGELYDGLGWSLARAGDIDGDGIDDIWAGATSNPERGRVYLLSGRDGRVVRTIDGPARSNAPPSGFAAIRWRRV